MTTATNRFFHLTPLGAAQARLEEAEHYFLNGNLNEALAAAQQAWREHPREPDVFRVLAYIHMARGEYPPAAQSAYQAVVLDGDSPSSHATLAQVYITFNMLPLAEESLALALQRFPEDNALLSLAADARFRRGREGEGVELATRALERNPHDGYAKALLGANHLRRRHYTAAAELLAEAIVAYPQRWDYQRDYGMALTHIQRYAEGREALARAFRLYPDDNLGKQYLYLTSRLDDSQGSPWWRMAFFFFRQTGLAGFMLVFGLLLLLVGGIWGIVALVASDLLMFLWPLGFFLAGLTMLVTAMSGLSVRWKRGARFDAYLSRMVEDRGLGR